MSGGRVTDSVARSVAIATLEGKERDWRPLLSGVSLVAELDVSDYAAGVVAYQLGRVCSLSTEQEQIRLLNDSFSACLTVAMPCIAAQRYDDGTFWPHLTEAAGLPRGQLNQGLWGKAFLRGLSRFRLPAFRELPLTYLGPILMHGGIPTSAVSDLVRVMVHHLRDNPHASGASFLEWGLSSGRASRLATLDKPIRYFLESGNEFAVDVIDRMFDLIDRYREPAPNFEGIGLPPRLQTAVRDALADLTTLPVSRRATASSQLPALILEPYGVGVAVTLPALESSHGQVMTWQITVDGQVETVRNRSAWTGGDRTPRTTVALSRPCRAVTVSNPAAPDSEMELVVVDPSDPLLIFDEGGRRIPTSVALPADVLWLLRPEDGWPLAVTGELTYLDKADVPYGWEGWLLERVDAAHVKTLRAGDGKLRKIGEQTRPRLLLSTSVPMVTGPDASPVYDTVPKVQLPADPGALLSWSVTVRSADTSEVLAAAEHQVLESLIVDPFEGVHRPLVGRFEIVVRGPLGRGWARQVVVVEGLCVASDPTWRELAGRGLVPARIRVTASEGIEIDPTTLELAADQRDGYCRAKSARTSLELRLLPEFMGVQHLVSATGSVWSTSALRLDVDSLRSDPGALLVRIAGDIADAELQVVAKEQVVQTVPSRRSKGAPVARFDLAAITDTVTSAGRARLFASYLKRRVLVADVQPRRLATGAVLDDQARVVLRDAPEVDDLVVGVYQVFAPWEPPVVMPVLNGCTDPMSEALMAAGTLCLVPRLEDPWLPADWPSWPEASERFVVRRPRSPGGASPLADYLAGVGPLECSAAELPHCFSVYQASNALASCGVQLDLRGAVAQLLRRDPAASLDAALSSGLSNPAVLPPLIEAGLAAEDRDLFVGRSVTVQLWDRSAATAVVGSSSRLGRDGSELGMSLREDAEYRCGGAWKALVSGAQDPCAGAGAFDQTALRLAALPKEQLDVIWRAAAVVPNSLLDQDSRSSAARELFDARGRPSLMRLADDAFQRVQEIRVLLVQFHQEELAQAVKAREATRGWTSLPGLSLAFALVARLAARGLVPYEGYYLKALVSDHARLARQAPAMAGLDLVLAEAHLLGAEARRSM